MVVWLCGTVWLCVLQCCEGVKEVKYVGDMLCRNLYINLRCCNF